MNKKKDKMKENMYNTFCFIEINVMDINILEKQKVKER